MIVGDFYFFAVLFGLSLCVPRAARAIESVTAA